MDFGQIPALAQPVHSIRHHKQRLIIEIIKPELVDDIFRFYPGDSVLEGPLGGFNFRYTLKDVSIIVLRFQFDHE